MDDAAAATTRLTRRLRPLRYAVLLQSCMLWVPVEKLFMTEIGFTATSVGVMAAAYAAVVPLVEVPSGILADRWSRRGLLVVSSLALAACALLGGLSSGVLMYIAAAMFLGVYFATYSGTIDAIVYDTVLEETGCSDTFEQRIGGIRVVESLGLVASSLAGGWLAGETSTRLTYLLSVPLALVSVLALLRFREPQLHKAGERTTLRGHLRLTYRTLTRRGSLLPIVTLAVLSALVLQVVFEFGPLWLVAMAVPAVVYGPYWAALVSTLGMGGLLAGRLRLDRPGPLGVVVVLMTASSLALTVGGSVLVVTLAQVVLCLLVVVTSIHVTHLLHDAVPSSIRSGVASGVSALSWITFLPVALLLGLVIDRQGVAASGWVLTGSTVLLAGLLVRLARGAGRSAAPPVTAPATATATATATAPAPQPVAAGAPCA
jgi:MFS family permease